MPPIYKITGADVTILGPLTRLTAAITSPTDTILAGIIRRLLRGDRWTQTEDGGLLYIDDSVDLTPTEQAAVLEAVKEA